MLAESLLTHELKYWTQRTVVLINNNNTLLHFREQSLATFHYQPCLRPKIVDIVYLGKYFRKQRHSIETYLSLVIIIFIEIYPNHRHLLYGRTIGED